MSSIIIPRKPKKPKHPERVGLSSGRPLLRRWPEEYPAAERAAIEARLQRTAALVAHERDRPRGRWYAGEVD